MQQRSDPLDFGSQGRDLADQDPVQSSARLTSLLVQCASGDRAALREIYELSAPRLRGLALRITGDRMLADDVLHDVFVRLMHAAARFDRERGSADAFLTMQTRFTALDLMRNQRREPTIGLRNGGVDAEDAALVAHGTADALQLTQCLNRLNTDTRRLIVLAFLEGRSHGELARMLSIPLGTVKSALRRGLIELRQCLDQ